MLKDYILEIANTDNFNYLKDLHEGITYDNNLSDDEAIALQKIIESKLYLIKNELFLDVHEFATVTFQ